jgi:cell division protease FtsH
MYLPEEDRYSASKERLESQISSLFGGRIAEELTLGEEGVTTGASNDIERATEIARNMVTKWGLSSKLGPLSYSEDEGEVFLGRSVTQHKHMSDETAHAIDQEIRDVIDRNYQRAETILKENMDKLHAMAQALMKFETIDRKQIDAIMRGEEPPPPSGWSDDGESGPSGTPPSEKKKEPEAGVDDTVVGDPA